jgi:MMPL family
MKLHANAALSLKGRWQLATRVVEDGWTLTQTARAAEVSARCARKVGRALPLRGRAARYQRRADPVSRLHLDGLRPRHGREDVRDGLAVGILIDAMVIRALIVPAVISLMGRWNWWLPSWPARLLRVEPSLPPRVAASEAE